MAVGKSGWLYFDENEIPEFAKSDVWLRFYKVRDSKSDWILMTCDVPKTGPCYQKIKRNRIRFDWLDDGTYEIRPHDPNSVYLAWISASTERKKKDGDDKPTPDITEPAFDPETSTVAEAREWLIWREFKLLKDGRVPQGWASVSSAFLDKIKEREKDRKEHPKFAQLSNGTTEKKETSELDLLYEIINSTASPKDRMAAQARLNELQRQKGEGDNGYNPQPVIMEIPDA